MAWDLMVQNAGKFDPKLLSLAFVFLLVGYGTKVGPRAVSRLAARCPRRGPDADFRGAVGPSAQRRALCAAALQDDSGRQSGTPSTSDWCLIAFGLVSLVFAAFMLYRRRDIKRLFAYSSIEHMGIMTFAFGMGGPLANFAGLLHMTMHSLTKSAIFFAVGHIAQVKGTQRIADIKGLSTAIRCWRWALRSASSRLRACRRSACSPPSSCWCRRASPVSRARGRAGVRPARRVRRADAAAAGRAVRRSRAGRPARSRRLMCRCSCISRWCWWPGYGCPSRWCAGSAPWRRSWDDGDERTPRSADREPGRRWRAIGRGRVTRSITTRGLRSRRRWARAAAICSACGARRTTSISRCAWRGSRARASSRCGPKIADFPVGRPLSSAGDPARARGPRSLWLCAARCAGSAALARSWRLGRAGAARRAAAGGAARSGRLRFPAGAGRGAASDSGRAGACRHHRARPFPLQRQRRDRGAARGAARLCPQGHRWASDRRRYRARGARGRAHLRRFHRGLQLCLCTRGRGGAADRSAAARQGACAASWPSSSASPITSRRHRRDLQRRLLRRSSTPIAASSASVCWRPSTGPSATG